MGDKVWQVQKELEELQAKNQGSSEVQTGLSNLTKYIFYN